MSSHSAKDIPNQITIPWPIVVKVSWAGIKRRFLRAMITLVGVILAIAFVSYMLVVDCITKALVDYNMVIAEAGDQNLTLLLVKNDIDPRAVSQTDEMMVLLMALTVFTCTIGILNSMLMAVTERVREIGTLKCLGARDQFIVRLYFIESTLQGIAGAAFGMIAGLMVSLTVMTVQYGLYTWKALPILAIVGNLLIAFVVGILMSVVSSILPAYSAARKQPIEALRVEE